MNKNDAFPSKYLTAGDLNGKPGLFVISYVVKETLQDKNGKTNQKPCIYFQGHEKGMVCNITNWDVISDFLGDESNNWTGKEIVLYPERVRNPFGEMTWSIRVRQPKNRPAPAPVQQIAPVQQRRMATADPALDDEIPF